MKSPSRPRFILILVSAVLFGGCASTSSPLSSWHMFRKPAADHSAIRPPVLDRLPASEPVVVRPDSPVATPSAMRTAAFARVTDNDSSNARSDHVRTAVSESEADSWVVSRPVEMNAPVGLTVLGPGDDLDAILTQTEGNTIVDFYADWCGPCRRLGATLHDLESEAIARHARIVKVNIDKHPELARRFGVKGLPTIVLIQGGREADRHTGLVSAPFLRNWMAR